MIKEMTDDRINYYFAFAKKVIDHVIDYSNLIRHGDFSGIEIDDEETRISYQNPFFNSSNEKKIEWQLLLASILVCNQKENYLVVNFHKGAFEFHVTSKTSPDKETDRHFEIARYRLNWN